MRTLITTKGAYHEPNPHTVSGHLAVCEEEGFWMDIQDPDEEDFEVLKSTFKFHPLTIEDTKHQNQRPKLEEYPGYAFMVIFLAEWEAGDIVFREHHLYVSKDYLVTIHNGPAPMLDKLRKRLEENPELTKKDPAFITYLVVDELVDALFPTLIELDETIDSLEDDIVENARPEVLRRIYTLKHTVTELRQFLGHQRDLFQRLISHSLEYRDQELTLYYRDIYDHIVRQYEQVDSLRDLLTGAMDVYLSTVSNRLNITMKALTVIASLFLPLTFLTGFYGMNFTYLTTVLEVPYWTFWVGVGTMLGAVVVQAYFFRKRGWI